MATSIPFSAHLIYHDMCRGNNIPGEAACYKMVCTFSRFIHHFFDGHARRGNQPQIPERFLVSAHIGSHLSPELFFLFFFFFFFFKRKKKRKAAK